LCQRYTTDTLFGKSSLIQNIVINFRVFYYGPAICLEGLWLSIKKLACDRHWPGQDIIHKSLPLKPTCSDHYIVNKKYKALQVHVTVGFYIFIYDLFSDAIVGCDYCIE
jgi:hypothetical protein